MTSPISSRIDLLADPNIRIVGLRFAKVVRIKNGECFRCIICNSFSRVIECAISRLSTILFPVEI